MGPDLDPNCLTQMVFLEEFFELDELGGKKTPQKQCKKKKKKKKTFIINQSANSYIVFENWRKACKKDLVTSILISMQLMNYRNLTIKLYDVR